MYSFIFKSVSGIVQTVSYLFHFLLSKHVLSRDLEKQFSKTFKADFRGVFGTAQKLKSFIFKDFFSKWDTIRRKLRIWSHLLKKSLMETFISCAVWDPINVLNVHLPIFASISIIDV